MELSEPNYYKILDYAIRPSIIWWDTPDCCPQNRSRNSNMREAFTHGQRLCITLRYLTARNNFEGLKFVAYISANWNYCAVGVLTSRPIDANWMNTGQYCPQTVNALCNSAVSPVDGEYYCAIFSNPQYYWPSNGTFRMHTKKTCDKQHVSTWRQHIRLKRRLGVTTETCIISFAPNRLQIMTPIGHTNTLHYCEHP
jgi:hypothetical protein